MTFKIFGIKINITTEDENKTGRGKDLVQRRAPRGFTAKKWNQEDTDRLILMYNAGNQTVGIARMLKRTNSAILSKLWKLKRDGIVNER